MEEITQLFCHLLMNSVTRIGYFNIDINVLALFIISSYNRSDSVQITTEHFVEIDIGFIERFVLLGLCFKNPCPYFH